MTTPLWICEECGGPSVWTMIDGLPYYHCEQQCDGFMQIEMDLAGSPLPVYIDRVGSVSALAEAEAHVWSSDEFLHEQYRRFLNGS